MAKGDLAGPLFQNRAGGPLTKSHFVSTMQRLLDTAGIANKGYTGHSRRKVCKCDGTRQHERQPDSKDRQVAMKTYVSLAPTTVAKVQQATEATTVTNDTLG